MLKTFCEECGCPIDLCEAEECPTCGKTLCYDCMHDHECIDEDDE